jgi:antitoxin (DNA-binding transcriptional repressor) of toxin-antitoxin stability system
MKTASVTQSKNGLSHLLRSVKGGKSVLIFDRNVPVARLEPIAAETLPDDARLLALERQGLIRRPLRSGGTLAALKSPRPKPKNGASLVAAVLAERRETAR